MPRWNDCYIDSRAIENRGQWGLYKCEFCGKEVWKRMCAVKRNKHIYCNTECKKASQYKKDRMQIDNKLFNDIYKKYYERVKRIAFKQCPLEDFFFMEDCMQYGFLELWNIYNRNKLNCSLKYIDKSIRHRIIDFIKYENIQRRRFICWDSVYEHKDELSKSDTFDLLFVHEDNPSYDYKKYIEKVAKENTKEFIYLSTIDLISTKEARDKLAMKFGYKNNRNASKYFRYKLRKTNPDIVNYLKG